MKFNPLLPSIALSVIASMIGPNVVAAQTQEMHAARDDNAQATQALAARIPAAQARVADGRRSGKVTRTQARRFGRQISQLQASMTQMNRRQGFVSAAELASYNRTLDEVDTQLDRLGVDRSYGNDALPSAEMIAFQKVDARLHYRDARFEYDSEGCALYQGTAPDGQIRRERLLSEAGRPFCTKS